MSAYPDRPVVGIGVIVFKGDRVLLVRRGKPPSQGHWSLPGGRQELGETVRNGARREVREETGLDIELGPLLDVVDSLRHDDQGKLHYHFTLVDFLAEWRAGEATAGSDVTECCWADPNKLDPYNLWSETIRLIRMGQAQRSLARTDAL